MIASVCKDLIIMILFSPLFATTQLKVSAVPISANYKKSTLSCVNSAILFVNSLNLSALDE